MFTVVFAVCLMSAPQTCDQRTAGAPPQPSFSDCLHVAQTGAALFVRQNRGHQIMQILCRPSAPGKGR